MTLLALLALVASVLVWAAPSSQAQANQAPFADAGTDDTVNPGDDVTLSGADSVDVDDDNSASTACEGCEYEWEVETGPYDWIQIGEDATTATDDTSTTGAFFEVPSEAFVDKVADSDPQKYEIVVRLTVTDNDGATDSDTVSININQRPVADIQVYAGLRDEDIVDGDLGARGHFPDSAVIDGPGENGNRDNEWDIMEGAYLQLSGAGSTDENPLTGRPSAYQWTRVRPATAAGYADSDTAASPSPSLEVAVALGGSANVEVIDFGDLDGDGIAETISVAKLPDVEPNAPQTVFYQLTVCDSRVATTQDITNAANCAGRTGATLIRIVVHDTSATPEVEIEAALTSASDSRGDAAPQETVGAITGVENQFIVGAGSTVLLTAAVEDEDQATGHNFRWSGATAIPTTNTATVRVPADADDGDTVDVSVTVTDATRISVTTEIQLLVGENTPPTAGGVPSNGVAAEGTGGIPGVIGRSIYTDGIQSREDGATITLRGVGNDADGDSLIHAWVLRETPDGFGALMTTARTGYLTAVGELQAATTPADRQAAQVAIGTALAPLGLGDLEEPEKPLIELNGAFTDTVSFDAPELETGMNKGVVLIFTVIDSNGVSDSQLLYIEFSADDDVPNAKAGADEQVDPGDFVRLNGSASSDPDVGDKITRSWAFTGATMDPAPDDRSPLSDSEIDELKGWILRKATDDDDDKDIFMDSDGNAYVYIVNSDGDLIEGESTDNLKSTGSAYPWFDAPDLSGFNNIKLTFTLYVKDSGPTNIDGDDAVNDNVASLDEANVGVDLNGDGDTKDTGITEVKEADLGLDLNNDGDAKDVIDLDADTCGADGASSCAANEANVAAVDSDDVTITVVNRFFSGTIGGPDFCTNRSLGGPATSPFDSDDDGVADTCSLSTTRRATVARQNAVETLANLNPAEFRTAVLAVCGAPGFKQANYGDDPADLDGDVCETERVTPPPAAADPATADVFFSGAVTGPDFCTNHSLGGARTYAFDSDDDGTADVCSLATTRREAIARQNGLNSFIVSFTDADKTGLTERQRLVELEDADPAATGDELNKLRTKYGAADRNAGDALSDDERAAVDTSIEALTDKQSRASRYSNAVDAACRALGTQDFGDAASALARDACAPKSGPTGTPLS